MLVLPLFDNNPTSRKPFASWMFLSICILVFLWQQSLVPEMANRAFFQFGLIPSNASGVAILPPDFAVLPAWATIFTSMFMHGGWLHIVGNMLFLWIFGDNVEESMGRGKFILFYLLCGVAAALAQIAVDPSSQVPMVGASGAIAGVLGAYLVLHPKAAVRTFIWIVIFARLINLPAWLVLGVWIGGQFLSAPNALAGADGGVAYFAHIGGFIAGMVLVPFFKHRYVALFGRNDPTPDTWATTATGIASIRREARRRYRPTVSPTPLGSMVIDKRGRTATGKQPKPAPGKKGAKSSVPSFTHSRRKPEKSGPWS